MITASLTLRQERTPADEKMLEVDSCRPAAQDLLQAGCLS